MSFERPENQCCRNWLLSLLLWRNTSTQANELCIDLFLEFIDKAFLCLNQTLVSRETNPVESNVVSVTWVKGGDAYNVIPDSVRLGGTLRQVACK